MYAQKQADLVINKSSAVSQLFKSWMHIKGSSEETVHPGAAFDVIWWFSESSGPPSELPLNGGNVLELAGVHTSWM